MDYLRDIREKSFLINDEYLNGYAKLCGINATGVYVSLCRHANKEQTCFPSKKLMAEELSISERSVYTALKQLEKYNIVNVEEQGRKNNGSFLNKLYTLINKRYWKKKEPQANGAVGKKRHSPQANDDIHRRHLLPNKETHKRRKHIEKETHKAKLENFAELSNLFNLFSKINPTINYGNKTERNALKELIKKGGYNKMLEAVRYAIKIQGEKYAPVITTPLQLKNKLGSLIVYWKKNNNKANSKYIKIS